MVAQVQRSIAFPVESPVDPALEPPQRYTLEQYLAIESEATERLTRRIRWCS